MSELRKPFNLAEFKMDTFMGKRVSVIKENLYKLEESLICSDEDIADSNEYPFGVLYEEAPNNMISVKYVMCGYHERHLLTQEIFNGTIEDTGLRYTENGMFEPTIGGLAYANLL